MMTEAQGWPEPVVRVQQLSVSGIRFIPDRYVKEIPNRPVQIEPAAVKAINIPVVDMAALSSGDGAMRREAAARIDEACREWGFFQVVNHGVGGEVAARCREAWREFFALPAAEKEMYANSPATYEGYGSCLGVEEGISLDWSDYFFLHYLPVELRDEKKWPSLPVSCRELVAEYCREVDQLCGKLVKIFEANLGLRENYLLEAFGGAAEACMRVNYYPKCPQPDLTLGLSPHSDPGGLTILCPDENVSGLQVRRGDDWITVDPVPNSFIVNVGDQLQILSNANYRSVEHRVVVNSEKERVSMAFFYNPKGEMVIKPAAELVTAAAPPRYPPIKYSEYTAYVRTKGPSGKAHVESLKLNS